VPETIKRLEQGGLKASYHASGQFHVKVGGRRQSEPEQWSSKQELEGPFRLSALITKAPSRYTSYARPLMRGGASALVIPIPETEAELRHYFEFFLSPPGEFPIPPTMIKTKNIISDKPICHSSSEHHILVVRHLVMAESMRIHEWQPDLAVWFFAREIPASD